MLMANPLGAVTPISTYQAKAKELAATAVAPNQVVAVNIGATTGRLFQYYSEDEANDSYGLLAGDPGAYVYIALIRGGEVIEEAYFAGKETDTVVTKNTTTRVPWGLIAAATGLVAVVGGAVWMARR